MATLELMTRYLLDTNVLLRMVRDSGSAFIGELESQFELLTGRNRVYLSYVTIGEIRSLAERNRWGVEKRTILNHYIGRFPTLNVTGDAILNAYVEIDTFNFYRGREMGSKNDLWIAATANVYELTLITTDKDFDHLDREFLTLAYLDPANL